MKSLQMLLMAALSIMTLTGFSQEKAGKKDTTAHVVLYACPMHPDVTSEKPDKCSKCGMDLTLSPKEKMKKKVVKNYACPLHADVLTKKPGKCPKCGSDLILSPKEKMKMEVMKKYTCSMHTDVASDKPGKCPKCNMDLTEVKKEDHSGHQH